MQNKIGILGLGTYTTNFYIEQLHKKYHQQKGGFSTFPFLLYQVDFDLINPYLPNQFEKLIPVLQEIVDEVEKLNIQKWLIPNITLHEVFDKLKTDLQIIHPIDLLNEFCDKKLIDSLVIFGTNYTMNSDFIPSKLADKDIKIIDICESDAVFLDELRTKIYNQQEIENDVLDFQEIANQYAEKSYIVIACTELSIISSKIKSNRIIDLARLQIDEAIEIQNTNQ